MSLADAAVRAIRVDTLDRRARSNAFAGPPPDAGSGRHPAVHDRASADPSLPEDLFDREPEEFLSLVMGARSTAPGTPATACSSPTSPKSPG